MDFYYGTQLTKLATGKRFRNPSVFSGKADVEATRVIVVGNWPRVVNAYRKLGVQVIVVDENDHAILNNENGVDLPPVILHPAADAPVPPKPHPRTAEPLKDQLAVSIPADWEQMPWVDLRRLAASVSNTPIINRVGAVEAIRAAILRRKGVVDGDDHAGT
jgi:hypothetical protein